MHCAMPRRCVHALLRLDACGPLNNWLGAQIGEERAREAADESRSAKEEAAAAKGKAEALSAELEVEQLRRNHLEDLLEKMFMEQEIYGKQHPERRGGDRSPLTLGHRETSGTRRRASSCVAINRRIVTSWGSRRRRRACSCQPPHRAT